MNFLRNVLHETGLVVGRNKEHDVTDPEMDAAIATMRHRWKKLRQQREEEREQNSLEKQDLLEAYEKSKQRLYDRLDVQKMVQNGPLMLYMTACNRARDYLVPAVVAKLQAELCLHVHALCMHNEQLRRQQHDADIMVWWYEDMRKQLRNDQSQSELELMNQMVQTKMELGVLVDAKKLRAQQEPRRQISSSIRRNSSVIRGIPRRMISHTNKNKDKSIRSVRPGLRSTLSNKDKNIIPKQQPRRRSSLLKAQQHGSVITLEDLENYPEHLPTAVTTSVEHQRLRVVRKVSRPGTALQNPKTVSTKVKRRSITMVMSMTRMALGTNSDKNNNDNNNSDDSSSSSQPFLDGDDWTDSESENEEDEEENDTSNSKSHHQHSPGLYSTTTAINRDGEHDHLSMSEKTADSTCSSVATETAVANATNKDDCHNSRKETTHNPIGSGTTKKKNAPPKKAYTGIEDMINESSRHKRRQRRRRGPTNKTKAMEDGSNKDIQARRGARAKARAVEKEKGERCSKSNSDNNSNDDKSNINSSSRHRGTRHGKPNKDTRTNTTKTMAATRPTRSRPIQRGVVRTRSKSLTEMGRGRRAGRKNDVSPRRQPEQQEQPPQTLDKKNADNKARAVDDSDIAMSTTATARRRSSMLRGFAPAPELLALSADMDVDDDDDENVEDDNGVMKAPKAMFRRSFKLEQQCCSTWVG